MNSICGTSHARLKSILVDTPLYQSDCNPNPIQAVVAFDPYLERVTLLKAWVKYRHMGDMNGLDKLGVQEAIVRDFARNGDSPPLAWFADFNPDSVSESFLISWLSRHSLSAPTVAASQDEKFWVKMATKRLDLLKKEKALVNKSYEDADPSKVIAIAASQLSAVSRMRDIRIQVFIHLEECYLNTLSFKEFDKLKATWINPKHQLKESFDVSIPKNEFLDFDRDLQYIIAYFLGAAATPKVVNYLVGPPDEDNRSNRIIHTIFGQVPRFLGLVATKRLAKRITTRNLGLQIFNSMKPFLKKQRKLLETIISMAAGNKTIGDLMGDLFLASTKEIIKDPNKASPAVTDLVKFVSEAIPKVKKVY